MTHFSSFFSFLFFSFFWLQSKEIPIKMNTAAILREGQLYQKIEAEEMKK